MMRRVCEDLRAVGMDVWTDEGIEPGSFSWKEAIEAAIRDTGIVVVLLSPSANDSRWVQREIDYAEVQHKPILPLLIRGDMRSAVPFALAGAQFVDMRTNYQVGLSILVQRCYQYLPSAALATMPSRPPASTYVNPVLRKKRKRQHLQKIVASLFIASFVVSSMILIFLAKWKTQSQVKTSLSTEALIEDSNIEIIYNNKTLVVHNVTSETLSLNEVRFELQTGQETIFEADDWLTQTLLEGRCMQVWDIRYGFLSPNIPPADVCHSRVAYRATVATFWLSSVAESTFAVKVNNVVIAECPTINRYSTATMSCGIKL